MQYQKNHLLSTKLDGSESPQERDEKSVSGHMTSPEADNTVDEQLAKVGLYVDEEKPAPLNISKEVRRAEKLRRQPKVSDREGR